MWFYIILAIEMLIVAAIAVGIAKAILNLWDKGNDN